MKLVLITLIIPFIFLSCVNDLNKNRACSSDKPCFEDYTCVDEVCIENLCKENPCKNNGECKMSSNGYNCECSDAYEGKNCEININDCESNPCLNGGVCTDGINSYICDCIETGYKGHDCEINIDDCESEPCQNGTECKDLLKDYICECEDSGFIGKNCEIEINECNPNPCRNNGVCKNEINKFTCNCNETGFTGETCEENIEDCQSGYCNNGICKDGINTYTCICHEGYELDTSEQRCVNINECTAGDNDCEQICNDTEGSFTCSCNLGFELNTDKKSCDNINDCELNPCLNGGTCIDGLNIYTCDCSETGYYGNRCEMNINECNEGIDDCEQNCQDTDGSFTCSCEPGHILDINGKDCNCEFSYQDNDADGFCTYSCQHTEVYCLDEDQCNDSTGSAICSECKEGAILVDGTCKKLGIFVTQGSWTGDLGGVYGADEKCNTDLNKPVNNSYYKALIGLKNVRQEPSSDWPLISSTPYYRANDKDIKIGTSSSDARFNIEGGEKLDNPFTIAPYTVWTALDGHGTAQVMYNACNGWTSVEHSLDSLYANSNTPTTYIDQWETDRAYQAISASGAYCDEVHHLYCVEQACSQGQTYNVNSKSCN